MDFRLLDPLEVSERDRSLSLGGLKQRSLLAILLLHANEVVSSDRLIGELWGETPPVTAAKSVQVYVSRLRKELGSAERGREAAPCARALAGAAARGPRVRAVRADGDRAPGGASADRPR